MATEPTPTLEPCPFCGGGARRVKHSAGVQGTTGYDQWHGVSCATCNACVGASDRRFRTPPEAIAAWNRRAQPAPAASQKPLAERQIAKCIASAGCLGTVKMSFESGPYSIDRPTLNATKLVQAIEAAHGITKGA